MNLPPDQEQMVWLVDFEGWNMSMIPLMTARETAHVLQNHYPERLAYAILYNPPKVFEVFWNVSALLHVAFRVFLRGFLVRHWHMEPILSIDTMEPIVTFFLHRSTHICSVG